MKNPLTVNEIIVIIKTISLGEYFQIGEYKNNFFIKNSQHTLSVFDRRGKIVYDTKNDKTETYIKDNAGMMEIISKMRGLMFDNPSKSCVYVNKERFLEELGIKETSEQKTIKILKALREQCVKEDRIQSVEDITKEIIQLSGIQVNTREYDGITIITCTEGKLKSELRLSNEMLNKESKSLIQELIYQHFLQHHGEDIE